MQLRKNLVFRKLSSVTEVEFNCGCGYVLFSAETEQSCSVGDSFLGGDRERVVAVGAEKCCRQRSSCKSYWGKLHSRPSGSKGGFVEDFKFCSEFVSVVTEV